MYEKNSKLNYYVYIVYEKQDIKWARWLTRKFKYYRLPADKETGENLVETHYSPVLHNSSIIENSPKDIKSEIEKSKYLLVICSESCAGHDEEINVVIDRFLEGGGGYDRIIPFIVGKSDKPEAECFPGKLRDNDGGASILGTNIFDSGKDNAFLKVLAYMYEMKLEHLESEEKRRKKKREKRLLASGIFLLLACCVGAFAAWNYYVPKTKHYLDFTTRYGMPVGIEEIKDSELEKHSQFYTIVSSRNKVRELRYEDRSGNLCINPGKAEYNAPVHSTYEYNDSGELKTVIYYDDSDTDYLRLEYRDINTIELYYDYEEKDIADYLKTHISLSDKESANRPMGFDLTNLFFITSLNFSNVEELVDSAASGDDSSSSLEGIIRYLVFYDEKGYLSEVHYCSSDVYNIIAFDKNGIGGFRFTRDAKGRVTKTEYLLYYGQTGRAKEKEFYEVVQKEDSVASVEYFYEDHKLVKEVFLDCKGNPIVCEDDYTYKTYLYDDRGLVEVTYDK